MLNLKSFIFTETLVYACPTITSFSLEIILKLFIHQKQWMLHPISLSFSFSTVRPPPRSAWIKTPGNIHGPGKIGLSPRTRVLLEDFKTSKTDSGHHVDPSASFKVINCQRNGLHLRFAESAAIRKCNPSLCTQKNGG